MSPLMQAKLAGGVALILLVCLGIWFLHHDGYEAGKTEVQAEWYAERTRIAEEQKAALAAYADKLKKAEEQHDQDQAAIDDLHDAAGRVRIHLPACTGNARPGGNQDGSAGVFPDRVDQLFAEFQARTGSLIRRCDQLNIDAIRANSGP
jgi:hypothetical protein